MTRDTGYLVEYYEMVSKLISAAISFFRLRLRQVSQKDFHRSSTAPQVFLLTFLVSPEKLKFRDEKVLKPSLSYLLIIC